MKRNQHGFEGGFTLLELLVVIALIAILAVIGIAAFQGVFGTSKRKQTEQLIVQLEAGIDQYHIENGIYPPSPENPVSGTKLTDEDARKGAQVLYRYLSGDFDLDGRVDGDVRIKPYVDSLDWWSNRQKGGRTPAIQRSFKTGAGEYLVIDPFSSPIRYLAAPAGFSSEEKRKLGLRNPGYDLWSLGGGEPDDEAGWITNWGAN